MKLFDRIFGIFYRPGEVYQNLSEKPDWIVPFILVMIVSLIFVSITYPRFMLPDQVEIARDRLQDAGLSEEQIEARIEAMTGTAGKVSGPLVAIFAMCFLLFGRAGIFLGIFSLIGGKSSYKNSLAVVSYAMLIHVLDAIVKGILMFIKQSSFVYTSLALLMPGGNPLTSKPFQLLARFDIFTIWELSLLSIGFAIMNKLSIKKSAGIIFGIWIIWIVLSVLLGGAFQFG
jgi:hypothetical protein